MRGRGLDAGELLSGPGDFPLSDRLRSLEPIGRRDNVTAFRAETDGGMDADRLAYFAAFVFARRSGHVAMSGPRIEA